MDGSLTERQQREREYYSVFSRKYAEKPVDFDPVDRALPPRPWNPYWYSERRLLEFYDSGARRLLDFGCGWGDVAIRAARAGFEVHGFDITDENVAIARTRAEKSGLSDRAHFTVAAAEQLHYPDTTFDVVIGIDILHHVDIPAAMAECHRVLRPGGRIVFKEPVEAPLFDKLRNTWIMRKLFPNEASLADHITKDERKLDRNDVRTVRDHFPDAEFRPFRMLARAERVLPLGAAWQKLDMHLLDRLPPLRPFAGFVVIEGIRPER